MKSKDPKVTWITQGAAIAALYVVLTLVFAPISFGPVQLRVAEALCILPMFTPAAIPGLFIGCLIANLYTGMITDIIFGSLATLLAAIGTYLLRKKPILAAACPVLANAVIVGLVLSLTSNWPIPLTMLQVGLGETGAVLVGFVILSAMKRAKVDLTRLG